MSTPQRTFRQRLLDQKNRRSTNIEDRRHVPLDAAPLDSAGYGGRIKDVKPDLSGSIPLSVDFASVSPHERKVARYRAEGAAKGHEFDEQGRTLRRKRGLRNVRVGRR